MLSCIIRVYGTDKTGHSGLIVLEVLWRVFLFRCLRNYFWAPLKTYQDRDEYNFDFEQGDSVHRRAGSPSCADQRSSEPKVFRFERLAACCALVALLSPRQGFQPNRWRESLACITANRQSRHMRGFQRCPKDEKLGKLHQDLLGNSSQRC